MPEDKYLLLGKYFENKNKIFLGGEITVYEKLANDKCRIEGTINKGSHQIKGFAQYETLVDKIITTLMFFEYPLKDDSTNIIYTLEKTLKKDMDMENLALYDENIRRNIQLKNLELEGEYTGKIYRNATIELIDEELLEDMTDITIPEFIFPFIDFDEKKGLSIRLELEKYTQPKTNAA
jgi:hypothetical protein